MIPILAAVATLADIIVKLTVKNPETAPAFAPIVGSLIVAASQAAGESPEQTAARLAAHDALVLKWGSMPPLNK